jgi:penicillin amidase
VSRLRRWAGASALALLALVLGLAAYAGELWHSGRPWRGGEFDLGARDGPVTVRFDAWGVPHVQAGSEGDLARALGFLHANDRLFQMELGRRAAAGRLAEVFGAAALPVDVHLRTLDLAGVAAAMVDQASARARAWYEAYAEGVNAWLERRGPDLPPEFRLLAFDPEPWRPADSAAFALLMAYDLSGPGRTEERRAQWLRAVGPERLRELLGLPDLQVPPGLVELVAPPSAAGDPRPAGLGQSNNWAVGASRSSSGHALLAGDPHLSLALPARFYLARLSAPGFEAFGATLPGTPAVVIGRSARSAWSLTTTGLDADDTTVEELDPAGARVRRAEGWLAVERRPERFRVRFGGSVERSLGRTDRGPLLEAEPGAPGLRGHPRSLSWTALEGGDPLTLFLRLCDGAGPEQVLAAAAEYGAPAQNLLLAHADEGLLLTVVGRAPRRRGGDGRLPVPGWLPGYGFDGLEPQRSNPTTFAGDDGALWSANGDVRPEGYTGTFLADWAPPHRTRRIAAELEGAASFDLERLTALQRDLRSEFAAEFRAALAQLPRDDGSWSAEAQEALAALASWDGVVEGGGGALFVLVLREGLAAVFADEWELGAAEGPEHRGPEYALLRLLRGELSADWYDDRRTEEIEGREAQWDLALSRAWRAGRSSFGSDRVADWDLGRIQQLQLEHPLSGLPGLGALLGRGPLPIAGHSSTLWAVWASWRGEVLRVHGGTALRLGADAGDPRATRHVQPGGQSGHPADAHYADQLSAWAAGELCAAPWDPPAVDERRTLRLR